MCECIVITNAAQHLNKFVLIEVPGSLQCAEYSTDVHTGTFRYAVGLKYRLHC